MNKPTDPTDLSALEDKAFVFLLLAVSAAFAWILWPFYQAVLWAAILAILFAPIYQRLVAAMRQRPNLAAITTVTIILLVVILPSVLITVMLVQEALGVYERIRSGELNFAEYFRRVLEALPPWASDAMDSLDITDLAALQERLSASMAAITQYLAPKAMDVGQNTLSFLVSFFIMLYLLFFLLRDGRHLAVRIRDAIPLQEELLRKLSSKFTTVVRATIKGNIVVAIVQGALGGLIFWLLDIHAPVFWAVIMAFLSLLPAVGTALVWLPVAVYFLVTGLTWQGLVLIAYGVLVIGLVDNVLRPMLVGKDTKLPDYVVLVTTLGGMAIFGLSGFVIGPLIAAMFIAAWDTLATSKARMDHGA